MADDEFSSGVPDHALAAALDAAERAARPAPPHPPPPPPPPHHKPQQQQQQQKQKVQQPVPQRVAPRGAGAASAIIVSPRQRGNPILAHIKSVPWEYGQAAQAADYLLSSTACALFLSLKYHKLHPDYIHTRLRSLGPAAHAAATNLRVLLVLVDVDDHADVLRALTRACVAHDISLFLCWSAAEAGRYLEAFKASAHVPPTAIMEKPADDYGSRLAELFTRVRGVNRTDCVTLVSTFGSVRAAINASPAEVMLISGWGPQKVARLQRAVTDPFRVGKRPGTAAAAGRGRARATTSGSAGAAAATAGAAVAERLGIAAPQIPATADRDAWVIEDDEEALKAVAELENRELLERQQQQQQQQQQQWKVLPEGRGRGKGGSEKDGIMQALAKLRENES